MGVSWVCFSARWTATPTRMTKSMCVAKTHACQLGSGTSQEERSIGALWAVVRTLARKALHHHHRQCRHLHLHRLCLVQIKSKRVQLRTATFAARICWVAFH